MMLKHQHSPTSLETDAAVAALMQQPRTLPSSFFYDAEGCQHFDRMKALPAYYIARTETALLNNIVPKLVGHIRPGAVLVEYGGSSIDKAHSLLKGSSIETYAPIDLARNALDSLPQALDGHKCIIKPIVADFTRPLPLPDSFRGKPIVGLIAGTTIGNFETGAARSFLHEAHKTLGPDSIFLIGVDACTDPDIQQRAYDDDGDSIVAAFHLNTLKRLKLTIAQADLTDAICNVHKLRTPQIRGYRSRRAPAPISINSSDLG